jgi:LysM repeat protein
LWKIAKRYYTTVDDLLKINEIEEPDKIIPGIKLIIPKKIYK